MDTLTFRSTSILACHGHVDSRFIDKDTIFGIKVAHLLLVGLALCLDVIRITLGGMLRLVFRVSCSLSRTLCILDLLGVT
jgi:hypothetical protein